MGLTFAIPVHRFVGKTPANHQSTAIKEARSPDRAHFVISQPCYEERRLAVLMILIEAEKYGNVVKAEPGQALGRFHRDRSPQAMQDKGCSRTRGWTFSPTLVMETVGQTQCKSRAEMEFFAWCDRTTCQLSCRLMGSAINQSNPSLFFSVEKGCKR